MDDLGVLNEKRWRLMDVGKSADVAVVASGDHVASLRVTERVVSLDARDESGAIAETQAFDRPLNWLVLLTDDADGRWRIASVDATENSN